MYIIARIILGFGIPFCIVAGSSLLGELGYPKERPILTSLFNSSYFIGQIIAASVGLGTVTIASDWAWRIPSLLQIAPAMIQIATVMYDTPCRYPYRLLLTLAQVSPRKSPILDQQRPLR